jgi:MoaA/NifB/PqqE/SkfB family radical SAM enzyme
MTRGVRPRLHSLTLTLTEACNLACRYCYQRPRGHRTMSDATLAASLGLAHRLGGGRCTLVLSGGEPLLAPDLVREAIAHRTDPIRLITNGTLLDAALLAELVAADIELQISCDGVSPAQDQRAPGTWAGLAGTLASLQRDAPTYLQRRVSLAMVITPTNVGLLSRSVAWALASRCAEVLIEPARGLADDWGEAACAQLSREMARVVALARGEQQRSGRAPLPILRPRSALGRMSPDACDAASLRSLTVAADGQVQGCGFLAAAARRNGSDAMVRAAARLVLGHVDDPELDARWHDRVTTPAAPLYPRSRRTAPGRRCQDCLSLRQCLVCPAAGPDPRRAPDAHCLFQRLLARPQDLGYQYEGQPRMLNAGTSP